jgi:hypothetical protein
MEQNYQNCFCSISTPDGVSVANKIMWYEPQASNIQPWSKITTMLPQMPIYINPSQADSK